jgi:hypothetical protein
MSYPGPGSGTLFNGYIPFRRYLLWGLKSFLIANSGRPVEVARTPVTVNDASIPADIPYVIIYPISTIDWGGTPLDYPNEMLEFVVQTTSVGEIPEQAEKMADMVRKIMVGRNANGSYLYPFTIANMTILNREMKDGGPGAITGYDRIYSVSEDFSVYVDAIV